MPELLAPTRTEARHERTESAQPHNFVDGAFAFALRLPGTRNVSLIGFAGGSTYALPGLGGPLANRYRKRLEARVSP